MNPEKRKQIQEETRDEWHKVKDLDNPHIIKYFGVEFQRVGPLLQHNFLSAYNVFTQNKCLLIMEFCGNGKLFSNVENNPMSPDMCRRYTAQVGHSHVDNVQKMTHADTISS